MWVGVGGATAARVSGVFYDPAGTRVTRVSGAYEHKGRLFVASFMEHVNYIAVLNLNCLDPDSHSRVPGGGGEGGWS